MSVLCICLGGGPRWVTPLAGSCRSFIVVWLVNTYVRITVTTFLGTWSPHVCLAIMHHVGTGTKAHAFSPQALTPERQIDLKTTHTLHLMQIGGHQAHLGA